MSTVTTLADTLAQEYQNVLHLNKKADNVPSRTNDHTKPGIPGPDYPYARLLPSYDQGYKLEPLKPFEHVDPGHAALKDPKPQSFLEGGHVVHLAPKFGSDISGVQLTSLGEREKRYVYPVKCLNAEQKLIYRSQLALYVAQRGVVVFRDQDFIDQSPEWQLESWGK
jgi:sulfonate dioxygenase